MKNESEEQKYFKEIIQRQRLSKYGVDFGTWRSKGPNLQQLARSPHTEQYFNKESRERFLVQADFHRNTVTVSPIVGGKNHLIQQIDSDNKQRELIRRLKEAGIQTFYDEVICTNKEDFEKAEKIFVEIYGSPKARDARAEDGSAETTGQL